MSILSRYLIRTNLFLTLLTLAAGTGIYLLSDIFDRLDDFLEAGLSAQAIVTYFAVKTPLIISQILPAVFLLAVVIQLCIMARNRELIALQAGGVSFLLLTRFFLVYALFWAILQLGFSQVLGLYGEKEASRIWKEDVRKRENTTTFLENVWFTEGSRVIHIGALIPREQRGQQITVYEFTPDGLAMERVVWADRFDAASSGAWKLTGSTSYIPSQYKVLLKQEIVMPIIQDVRAFINVDPKANPSTLPVWQLGQAITHLAQSGSNVEALRTAFHMKLAYAFSLVTMALLALALITWRDNIYLNIGSSLVLVFIFYILFTLGGSLGETGILPPVVAAWGGTVIFAVLATGRLVYVSYVRRRA